MQGESLQHHHQLLLCAHAYVCYIPWQKVQVRKCKLCVGANSQLSQQTATATNTFFPYIHL